VHMVLHFLPLPCMLDAGQVTRCYSHCFTDGDAERPEGQALPAADPETQVYSLRSGFPKNT